jgi:CheY-like chemotaxis protein
VSFLILVVDDEPDVELLFRQQFRRDLRDGRFAMEFAQSAQGALQRIAECDTDTSLILILSDINMPGMSGLDLLPKAKAARPDVPVIMIAAYDDAETRRNALASGADAFLTKPIDFKIVRDEIDAHRIRRMSARNPWSLKIMRTWLPFALWCHRELRCSIRTSSRTAVGHFRRRFPPSSAALLPKPDLALAR